MQEFTESYSPYAPKHSYGVSLQRMSALSQKVSLAVAVAGALIGSFPLLWTRLWLMGAGYALIILVVSYVAQRFLMHQCIPEIKRESASVPKGIFWYTAGMVWVAQVVIGFIAFLPASGAVHWQIF